MSEARTTATDRVFARLREQIVSGAMPAGSTHSIYRLADAMEVSRTPVREAVLRLADHGLVSIERNRGVRVRGVRVDDVREVFELRLLIEVPGARHAARSADGSVRRNLEETLTQMRAAALAGDETEYTRQDRALHAMIGGVLDNGRVQAAVDRLRDAAQVRGVSTIGRSRTMMTVAEEHAPIVEAIVRGDPDAAAARMADHLQSTGTLLMHQVAAPGEVVDERWAVHVRALVE